MDDFGGLLPMVAINWECMPYNDGVQAIIGDDQPIPASIAAYMLESVGLSAGLEIVDKNVTLEQAGNIFSRLLPDGDVLYITDENREMYISYALWVELFLQAIELDVGELKNIIPLGLADGLHITNRGTFEGKDINLTAFFDMEIRVLIVDSKILAVLGVVDFSPWLRNVVVTHADTFGVTVAVEGIIRNYVYVDGVAPTEVGTTQIVASLHISGQEILAIAPAEAVIRGTIERVRPNTIELREWGELPLCPFFAVYFFPLPGYPLIYSLQDLLVGEDIADFHIIDGRVGAAVITHLASPKNIRVAISTTGFAELVHDSVTITSTGEFTVQSGVVNRVFQAGEHFTVIAGQEISRLYISPTDQAHFLQIVGLGRDWPGGHSPLYRGVFEVSPYNGVGGGFIVVNELCIEEYLQAVIPSEMPTSHGLEAAKVQAITARSYAIHQFYQNAFREFGAHVCDSVISQVYNNIPETETSRTAVASTRGQVLSVDGGLVIANYFSTSAGVTANFGEVWARGEVFPSETPPHLAAQWQILVEGDTPDLSREHYADAFFRSHDIPAICRQFPWFRWSVRLTVEELTRSINANIATRQAANPAMITITDPVGNPINAATIGTLTNIEIARRGQGGNIMEMVFSGTEATARVQTEFNIRTLLSPGTVPVARHDDSTAQNLRLLPSAFFVMDVEKDTMGNIAAVTFYGGGNGHGVGMSQNGVKTLVEMGWTYREILEHFYPGAEVIRYPLV